MNSNFFEHLQGLAQQESQKFNHFYLGVEHLFLALLSLENSLTANILKQHNVAPELVRYVLEETLGQNLDRRYWEGYRFTPRYQKIVTMAQNYTHTPTPNERELLLAILDEADNIPVRVLQVLQIDLESLSESAANWTDDAPPVPLDSVSIESDLPLLTLEKTLLQRLFQGSSGLEADHEFSAGINPARLYALTVQQTNEYSQASIVKFDQPAAILREKRHFDTFVSQHLPPNTPAIPTITNFAIEARHRLAVLQYDLADAKLPLLDLRQYATDHGMQAIPQVIQQTYESLRHAWWDHKEGFRFGFWREYEAVLQPALIVEANDLQGGTALNPLEEWSRNDGLRLGSAVDLQDFTIHSLMSMRGGVRLCASYGDEAVNKASRVDIFGVDKAHLARYSPGQSERRFRGMITYTRSDLLREQLLQIDPIFQVAAADLESPMGMLPNPIDSLSYLLQYEIEGYISVIHGSLNVGSLVVDGEDKVWLTDFTQTRRGHVLFDWAMLEISLLSDLIAPTIDDSWASVWEVSQALQALNKGQQVAELQAIGAVRAIVAELLATKGDWREYYAPLVFMGLSGLGQLACPLGARRLVFAAAALAAEAFMSHKG